MNPEQKKYISENRNKKTVKQIAGDLGIKSKEIHIYLEIKRDTHREVPIAGDSPPAPQRYKVLSAVLLVVIVFGVYVNSLGGPFLLDDSALIKDNPLVKSLSNIPILLTKDIFANSADAKPISNSYRPLQIISYAIDTFLWGDGSRGFHFTNILIHVISMLLVFFIARRLFRDQYSPFFAALLFGIHPVNTQCVSYVSGRADSLSAAFILLALFFYIEHMRYKKSKLILVSVAAYVCAVFTKEYAIIVLPLLLFLYNAVFKKDYIFKLPIYLCYFLSLAVYIPFRLKALSGVVSRNLELAQLDMFSRVFTSLKTLFIDARILLMPYDLHFGRTTDVERAVFGSAYAVLTVLGLVATACFLVISYKRWRREDNAAYGIAFFGISWFFISMLPLLNIVPLQVFHSDNWLYFPAIGIYLASASVLHSVLRFFNKQKAVIARNTIASVILLALIFYGFTTVKRNEDYGDIVKFYLSNLKWRPNVKFYTVLSGIYGSRDDLPNALKYSQKAIEVNMTYPSYDVAQAYFNLGLTNMKMQQYRQAEEAFSKVMILDNEGLKKGAADNLEFMKKGRPRENN